MGSGGVQELLDGRRLRLVQRRHALRPQTSRHLQDDGVSHPKPMRSLHARENVHISFWGRMRHEVRKNGLTCT